MAKAWAREVVIGFRLFRIAAREFHGLRDALILHAGLAVGHGFAVLPETRVVDAPVIRGTSLAFLNDVRNAGFSAHKVLFPQSLIFTFWKRWLCHLASDAMTC